MYTENSRGWRGGQVFMFYFKLKSRSGRFLAGPVFLLLAFEPAHAQAPQGSNPQSSSAPQSSSSSSASSSQDSSSQDSQNDRSSLGIPELPQGLRIVSASIFGSYYSSGVPNTSATSFNYANANLLGSDEAYGGTANVIYIKQRARDSLSLHYTPSYTRRVRFSKWDAFNQTFGANWTHKLTARMTNSLNFGASEQSLDQTLFNQTPFGELASTPTTFQDLTDEILKGNFTNNQIASLLTGTPIASSPAQTLIFGNRVLGLTLSDSLSWAYSDRLSFNFNVGASRAQHLPNFQDNNQLYGRQSYLLSHYMSGNAGVGASYALSPRTTIGFNAGTSRSFSGLANYYTTNASGSLSHVFNPRWFGSVQAGFGQIIENKSTFNSLSTGPHYTAGASLGYTHITQTILASYSHSVSSSFGLGAAYGDTANLAWGYHPLASPWSVSASAADERFVGGTLGGHLNAVVAQVGISRRLSRHFFTSAQYAYIDSKSHYNAVPYSFARNTAELALVWSGSGNAPLGIGY